MKRPEFEACLPDLAAERSHEDFLGAEALSHAKVCSRCAARLAEETALVAGLSAWAKSVRHETAPSVVEEGLLTRFRELERTKTGAPDRLQDIRSPRPAGWKIPGYVGLAASVLLLAGWALIQVTRETRVNEAQVQSAPKPMTRSEEKGAAAPLTVMPEHSSEPVRKPARRVKTRPPQVAKPVGEARVQYAARTSGRSEGRMHRADTAASQPVETEFLPFMAAEPQFPSEQRQFVRVKLPRSALQIFGLPMNMERAREPVQADVLLGEDGRALAVRFVRD